MVPQVGASQVLPNLTELEINMKPNIAVKDAPRMIRCRVVSPFIIGGNSRIGYSDA